MDTSRVKLNLRISHTKFDSEIPTIIEEARQEMIRSGLSSEMAYSDSELTDRAVLTYCKKEICNNEKMAEKYEESFRYQVDNLRKTFPELGGDGNV